jgi:hypothetical protein
MPFVIGAFTAFCSRAPCPRQDEQPARLLVLYIYFGAFSTLVVRLTSCIRYGHTLAPTAAVKVEPFMPPMFGYKQLANFEVYSYPALGSYALGAAAFLLVLAFLTAAWRARAERPAAR